MSFFWICIALIVTILLLLLVRNYLMYKEEEEHGFKFQTYSDSVPEHLRDKPFGGGWID